MNTHAKKLYRYRLPSIPKKIPKKIDWPQWICRVVLAVTIIGGLAFACTRRAYHVGTFWPFWTNHPHSVNVGLFIACILAWVAIGAVVCIVVGTIVVVACEGSK